MVQQAALEASHCYLPFTTLRDILLDPESQSHLTPPILRSLLQYHLEHLKSPSAPFKQPSTASRDAIKASELSIPRTSLKIQVDEASRNLALKLSERIQADEVECLIMVKSAGDNVSFDQLTTWAIDQSLVVSQIVIVLDQLRRKDFDEWGTVAEEVVSSLIPDVGAYIEGTFRSWAGLAQSQLQGSKRSQDALFWSRYQLRLQNAILDLLFYILYDTPDRPASISEGLVKGLVMSGFGSAQANQELWSNDPESNRSFIRIRDLCLIIAIESLCLTHVVTPRNEDEQPIPDEILLRSKQTLVGLNLFLVNQMQELPGGAGEGRISTNLPFTVLFLAWSVFLKNLKPDMHFPSPGYSVPMYQQFALKAFGAEVGVFSWLGAILRGPLFESAEEQEMGKLSTDLETSRRKVIKGEYEMCREGQNAHFGLEDMISGVSEMISLSDVTDEASVQDFWVSLYSEGSPAASANLCSDFWVQDAPIAARSILLDNSNYPRDAATLPRLLSAMSSSVSSTDPSSEPAHHVLQYLSALPAITILSSSCPSRFVGKDDSGRMTLETTRDIILPGGAVIPSGTAGCVITPDDAPVRYASWYTTVPTLGLIIEILRVAAGMRSPKDKAAYSPLSGDFVHLSVAELGIESDISEILLYGLSLIRALLRASATTANEVLAQIPSGAEPPSVLLLSLSLSILDGLRQTDLTPVNVQTAVCALDIIRSLAVISDSVTWTALRHTAFLGALGKRRSGAADLIVADSKVDQHDITLATLRLVQSIVVASSSTVRPVDITLRNSLHLGVSAIWADFTSWRYANPARKFEIASMLYHVFGSTLAHPLKEDGSGPTLGAEYLIETFITSASVMTYRPLIETLTQASSLIDELAASHRIADARLVVGSLENSLAFLSTLIRVATKLGVAANALPTALFALPVVTASGKKLQLVDHLFDLAVRPSLPSSTKLVVLRSLRTYLEAINADSHRPSLAALLRDANTSCAALSALTAGSIAPEVRAAVWELLATIIGSQPGCTSACIGQEGDKAEKEAPLAGLLRLAVDQVLDWYDVVRESPRILSSVLNYFNAIMLSPSAGSAILSLRDQDFWTAVQEIATRMVPAPPTFQLSMHAEDFASRIQEYAYDVQAKANATTLLAAELNAQAELPEDQPETKAQSLVMGLFRKGSQLVEAAESAMNSYCNPPLHEDQSQRLAHYGVNPATMQTPLLPSEREYGRTYLYDGNPIIPSDQVGQANVNFALDMLSLNWSMLDADLALTKAFKSLAEAARIWTEGDNLAMAACLKASKEVATIVADEVRAGDVMFTIQAERVEVLSILLDTALGQEAEVDRETIGSLFEVLTRILESQDFPPTTGLRHPEITLIPAIHRPILRILLLLLQRISTFSPPIPTVQLDPVVKVITNFTLEAADIVLDTLIQQSEAPLSTSIDLSLVVGILCEIVRTPLTSIWLNKVSEHNLIGRSLEVIVRMRINNDRVPTHITSILLLHLALASNPLSAEKLAVSGILPAYSNNGIMTTAEQGKIVPSSPFPAETSLHGGWCSILMVVKALLFSLPLAHAGTFARSDVVPFIRACQVQVLKTLSWDGATTLAIPDIIELELVSDILGGVARSIGHHRDLLDDLCIPTMMLLKNIRHSLSHPNGLSQLFVASTEEEHAGLEKELEVFANERNVSIVDFAKIPIISSRVVRLVDVVRTTSTMLVTFTRAWDIVKGDFGDIGEEAILETDDTASRDNADDPIGIFNDLGSTLRDYVSGLSTSQTANAISARQSLVQTVEVLALLSSSQLILRNSLLPPPEPKWKDEQMDLDGNAGGGGGGGGGKARRRASSIGGSGGSASEREAKVVYELYKDLMDNLPDGEDGQKGILVWLRAAVYRKLEGIDE